MDKKPHLSNSQVTTLTSCGEQYRRRYVRHDPAPVGLSLMVGTAVDKAVTLNLDRKMIHGAFLSGDEIRDITVRTFRRSVLDAKEGDKGILFRQEELLAGKDVAIAEAEKKAVRLALLHAREAAPKLQPLYLQRPLWVELAGYPFDLSGIVDVQEADCIRDTKTKNRTPAKTVADTSDQLTIYALLSYYMDGAIPSKLVLDCLIDNKTPIYRAFATTRAQEDFDVLLRRLVAAWDAIEAGAFIPARESDWWCGRDWCGYWETCQYVKRSRRPEN